MLTYIYIGLIILIILITLILIVNGDKSHYHEIKRIAKIEKDQRDQKSKINYYRLKTTPCRFRNPKLTVLENKEFLDSGPRECYFGSNYTCKYDIDAQRCNKA